ncbi:MAG: tetraacyldisaccharide 4'-kinase [Pantoea sp. Brub]|nr:tetraacyldisaccharide 4'-kinase [Pantoea sp. Brub]
MIQYIWNGNLYLWLILWPLSILYGVITKFIRFCFTCGLLKSWRAPVPVIVIGNLTVGGSGKTPLVIWLVKELQLRKFRIGVISRGYKGKYNKYPLLVTQNTSAQEAGDEAVLIAKRTNIPVSVSPNRRQAIELLLKNFDINIIISDDGLQHYALQRDIEIVVIDGMRRFGNGWWLPAGPMRERANRLQEVDAVIVNGGHVLSNEIKMKLNAELAINLFNGKQQPVHKLNNVIAIAGIGYPTRFFNTVKQHGLTPLAEINFPDHHNYNYLELSKLISKDQNLLMTEKDAIKCLKFATENWWYLPINVTLEGSLIKTLMQNIENLRYKKFC